VDEEGEGARELGMREEEREKQMPNWWEYDVSIPGRVGGVRAETELESNDRLQQHHIFSTSHGLERLILFMASNPEVDATEQEHEFGRSREAVDMESFEQSTLVERLDEAIMMSQSKERDEEAARLRALDAKAQSLEESKRLTAEKVRSGAELLLQAFMMNDEEGAAERRAEEGDLQVATAAESSGQSEHQRASLVSAGLRLVLALLRHGSRETLQGTLQVLTQPEVMRMLACVVCANKERPMFFEFNVGAKLLVIVEEVVRPDVQAPTVGTNVLPLLDTGMQVITRMLHAVALRLGRKGYLTEDEERVVLYASRVADGVARQVPLLALPPSISTRTAQTALEFLFGELFPRLVLRLMVRLLLYNMEVDADPVAVVAMARKAEADAPRIGLVVAGERAHVRDSFRAYLTSAIVEYLRVHEHNRFEVLEMFSRAEVELGLQLRQSFMQDMLHELATRMYRAHLESLMADKGYFKKEEGDVEGAKTERILDHAWFEKQDLMGSGRRLMVLSSRALYVLRPSVGFSLFSSSSAADPAAETDVKGAAPVLTDRIEYLDITRIVLGYGGMRSGQRLHLSTESVEDKSKAPSHFTAIFPRTGVAERFYSRILEVCRARIQSENLSLEQLPPLERDSITRAVVREVAGPDQRVALYTQVDLLSGSSRERRVLLLTEELLIIAKEDVRHWAMPIDWEGIERDERRKFEEHRARMTDTKETKEERARREAMEEQEQEEARAARLKYRQSTEEGYAKMIPKDSVIAREALNEVSELALGDDVAPTMTIGFGSRKVASDDQGGEGVAVAKTTYSIMFADDWARQLWRRAFMVVAAQQGVDLDELSAKAKRSSEMRKAQPTSTLGSIFSF